MPVAVFVIAALLLIAPLPVHAGVELVLGWDAQTGWNSNVFRDETDEQSDLSVSTGPALRLLDRVGDLRFDVSYRPRYQAFLELEDANAFEHFANVGLNWSITPRTELVVSNRFAETSTLNEILDDSDPLVDAGEVVIDRSKVLRNSASATLLHRLSERNNLEATFSHGIFEYDQAGRPDSRSFRGSVTARRSLDLRQTAGLGFAISRHNFLETSGRPETGTTIFEAFAVYGGNLSRSLSLTLSGGPRWSLRDDRDSDGQPFPQYAFTNDGFLVRAVCLQGITCTRDQARAPFFDLGSGNQVAPQPVASVPITSLTFEDGAPEEEAQLNYSALAVLAYRRERYGAQLSYTRRENPNSGSGVSTTLDVVALTGSWEPATRWALSFVASWQTQASDSDLARSVPVLNPGGATVFLDADRNPVSDLADAAFAVLDVAEFGALRSVDGSSSEFESTAYQISLSANYDLTRRLRLGGGVTWWQQTAEQTFRPDRKIDNLRFQLGFRWSFAPIGL